MTPQPNEREARRKLLAQFFDLTFELKERFEELRAFHVPDSGYPFLKFDIQQLCKQIFEKRAECLAAGIPDEELTKILVHFKLQRRQYNTPEDCLEEIPKPQPSPT